MMILWIMIIIRHGQPSVHKKWDKPTAILSGDAIFVLSQLLLDWFTNNNYPKV